MTNNNQFTVHDILTLLVKSVLKLTIEGGKGGGAFQV